MTMNEIINLRFVNFQLAYLILNALCWHGEMSYVYILVWMSNEQVCQDLQFVDIVLIVV